MVKVKSEDTKKSTDFKQRFVALLPDDLEDAKDKIIVMVNPRLKSFNKPLLLALLIGSITFVTTMTIFSIMMSASEELSFTGSAMSVGVFLRGDGYSCINIVGKMQSADETYIMDLENGDKEFRKDDVQELKLCRNYDLLASYSYVGPGTETFIPHPSLDDKFCSGSSLSKEALRQLHLTSTDCMSPRIKDVDDITNTGTVENPDPKVSDEGYTYLPTKLYIIEYSKKPPFGATLGAAFGYTGFIELFVTVILLTVLSQMGIINKDEAFIKGLVNSLFEEKNKEVGKEIGNTVGTV
jgi:hypothetical protein